MLLAWAGFIDQIGRNHVFDQLEHAVHALAPQTESGGAESERHV
jgi:hypothetical protein